MNKLDFAILAVVALGAIYGLLRGVLRMATSIVALAAGVYLASIYYPLVGEFARQHFDLGATAAAALGYVVVFAVSFVVVAVIGDAFGRLLHKRLKGPDRLGGAAVGVAVSGALVGVFLMVLTAISPVDAAILRESKLAPIVLRYTELLVACIPAEMKDSYQSKRAELERLWYQAVPPPLPSSPATK